VILATVPSGKAMTEILGGLAVNGKLVVIGASDEPIQVPISLMILGRRSLIGWPVLLLTRKTHSHLVFSLV
jgi:D-arabinose 1-dehydrogenase-like Zn-dependent alcohol dehydrogenase